MRYEHISQKPYCCVPACVQMILKRRRLRKSPCQADIAYDLGVQLPRGAKHLLPRYHKGNPKTGGGGTRIRIKKYSLGRFFKQRGYALGVKHYLGTGFLSEDQFRNFLKENRRLNNDILVCYNAPILTCMEGTWGHASLIESVRGDHVILRDPSPWQKAGRRIPLGLLFSALQRYGHYIGGVWVISEMN